MWNIHPLSFYPLFSILYQPSSVLMSSVIKVENVSKLYRLGEVGTGTLSHDLNRWYHRLRGKEDPYLKIGESNDRANKGSSEYVYALKDINFEVKEGEVLGIIGKNGAGKSTLLKLLSRVTGPSSGSIKIKGRTASLLEVGTGFHPELTGRENIFLNGAILGMTKSEIRRKFDEIVDFSGVERYIDTPVKRYSSGMYVRLAFAVAAHLDPEILIVDEVLAVGDAEFQKRCLGKMGDISKNEGRTILFVSHNMAAVKSLCGQGLTLLNGEVSFLGSVEDAIFNYVKFEREKSEILLSERTDRIGNQLVTIESIKFIDANNGLDLNYKVFSGQKVKIAVFFRKNMKKFKPRNIRVAIGFSTSMGCESFAVDNFFVKKKYESLEDLDSFNCIIDKWPNNVGSYLFRIHLEDDGVILDRVENAGSVTVEYGDFFNTGAVVSPNLNGLLIEQIWD